MWEKLRNHACDIKSVLLDHGLFVGEARRRWVLFFVTVTVTLLLPFRFILLSTRWEVVLDCRLVQITLDLLHQFVQILCGHL